MGSRARRSVDEQEAVGVVTDLDAGVDLSTLADREPDGHPGHPGPPDGVHGARPDGSGRPSTAPRWVRGPAGALAAALLAAALTAAVGVGHVRAAGDLARRTQEALLSLQVGTVRMPGAGVSVPVVDGAAVLAVVVPLVNHGSRAVTASVVGLTAAHQRTRYLPPPVHVPPGRSADVPVLLVVDCARTPGPEAGAPLPRGPSSVVVRLGVPGGTRTLRLPMLSDVAQSLLDELACACHPDAGRNVSTTWSSSADGHLHVDLGDEDPAGSPPVVLALQQSPGLGAVAQPQLPMSLEPGRSAQLDLSVQPDCAVVGDGGGSELTVVATRQGGQDSTQLDLQQSGPGGVTAWLARQIALRCG